MEIKYYHFDQLTSTSRFVKDSLDQFDKAFMHVVQADFQTHGVGRRGRVWVSPIGNLFTTFAISLPISYQFKIPAVSILLSLIAANALKEVDVKVKWPNDLMIDGKKCGGILAETVVLKDHFWLIMGLGINIQLLDVDQIDKPATSLHLYTDKKIDPKALAKDIAFDFLKALHRLLQEGFSPYYPLWQSLNFHKKGDSITVQVGDKQMKGTFEAIQKDGSITLLLPTNEKATLFSAEIV